MFLEEGLLSAAGCLLKIMRDVVGESTETAKSYPFYINFTEEKLLKGEMKLKE